MLSGHFVSDCFRLSVFFARLFSPVFVSFVLFVSSWVLGVAGLKSNAVGPQTQTAFRTRTRANEYWANTQNTFSPIACHVRLGLGD